jgi:hypothetical protein
VLGSGRMAAVPARIRRHGEKGIRSRTIPVSRGIQFSVEARRISPARGAPWWRTSGRKEPPAAGQRRGGGHRLRGHGAAVSSGGGRGGEGGWTVAFSSATLGVVA